MPQRFFWTVVVSDPAPYYMNGCDWPDQSQVWLTSILKRGDARRIILSKLYLPADSSSFQYRISRPLHYFHWANHILFGRIWWQNPFDLSEQQQKKKATSVVWGFDSAFVSLKYFDSAIEEVLKKKTPPRINKELCIAKVFLKDLLGRTCRE